MKHLQSWILWVLVWFFIRLPLMVLGFVIFPLAYVTRKRDDSLRMLFWIYDNEEDGIYGAPFWIARNEGRRDFKTAYGWSVLRNPVNNMRFTRLGLNRDDLHVPEIVYKFYGNQAIPDPRLARNEGKAIWHYSLVKRGSIWFPSFWYIRPWNDKKHFRIRLGWKCHYNWIQDKDLSQTGKYSGATFQFLPYRNG